MTDERWNDIMRDLMSGRHAEVTAKEYREGWHFCPDWDGLLIGPGMGELDCCHCNLPVKEAA